MSSKPERFFSLIYDFLWNTKEKKKETNLGTMLCLGSLVSYGDFLVLNSSLPIVFTLIHLKRDNFLNHVMRMIHLSLKISFLCASE